MHIQLTSLILDFLIFFSLTKYIKCNTNFQIYNQIKNNYPFNFAPSFVSSNQLLEKLLNRKFICLSLCDRSSSCQLAVVLKINYQSFRCSLFTTIPKSIDLGTDLSNVYESQTFYLKKSIL